MLDDDFNPHNMLTYHWEWHLYDHSVDLPLYHCI